MRFELVVNIRIANALDHNPATGPVAGKQK